MELSAIFIGLDRIGKAGKGMSSETARASADISSLAGL
jgi:hypothetical protein